MKVRGDRVRVQERGHSRRQHETQQEIRIFMRALSSYPERFADNPYLSFEQHLFSIAAISATAGASSRQS